MKRIFAIFLIFIFLLSGCSSRPVDENPGNKIPKSNTAENNKPSPPVRNYTSAYTGESVTKEVYDSIPFMTVIENLKAARPQAGLSDADIVFETMAEGGIPRFMAIFQSRRPSVIGPIRSDRSYFNELAQSYNLPFAHCGGPQTAIDEIKAKGLMSLDEMANSIYYYRAKDRKAPHNLFTSSNMMTTLIKRKNYVEAPKFSLGFDASYWNNPVAAVPATDISLKFSNYYSTEYTYRDGRYYKTMNGAIVPDKNNGEQLSAKNVIVQVTRISPIPGDKKYRVNVKLTGSGSGYVLSNGKYIKMLWKKDTKSSQTTITDENGSAIKLSPGNTWWEIIDRNSKITIK